MRATGVLLSAAAPHGGTLSDTGGHGLFGRKEGARGMEGSTYPPTRQIRGSFLSAAARIVAVSVSVSSKVVPYSAALRCGHTHTHTTD